MKIVNPLALAVWAERGLLARGRSILVPGCGRGAEPAGLARLGLAVTASDIAPSAVAWQRETARREGLDYAAIEADGLDWRPDAPFDLLWEQTFLCAIPPRDRERYAAMAADCVRPGGALLAHFMQKEERGGPPYGCPLEAMRALFAETDWIWPTDESFTPFPHPRLDGKVELGGALIRR